MSIRKIKKALIGILVLCSFQINTMAQTYSNKPSSILSFSLGLTSSQLYHDSMNYKSGILFNGGLGYSLMLNDRWNIGIEGLYGGKAFKTGVPIVKYRCFFADIPLYAQLKLGENIRFNMGAQFSIATNSQRFTIDQSKSNGVRNDNISNPVDFDYGILGGVEFDLSKMICIGVRYTQSVPTIISPNLPGFGVFQFSVKYSPIKTYKVFFEKKEVKQ